MNSERLQSVWSGRVRTWSRVVLCALVFALMSSGCSSCVEGEISTRPADPEARENTPGGQSTNANDYCLVANGATNYSVDVGKQIKLGVYLYSKSTGAPVINQTIEYEIVQGQEFGQLAAKRNSTKEDGEMCASLCVADYVRALTCLSPVSACIYPGRG